MKIILVVLMIKAIIALVEAIKGKNRKEVRKEAGDAIIQHPAANLMR